MCRIKQFSSALFWLFCTFCVLLGGRIALAQGTVKLSVSTSASQVTVGIGSAASFTATASASVTPDKEWSIQSGPTYSWSVTPSPASCNPTDQASTTVSATYNTAGTNPVQVTCTASYVMVKSDPGDPSDGSTATISGSNNPAATVNIYVIGGAITGDNDIHYYCDPSYYGSWGHLTAASGQPAGTTYSWSISGNGQYVPGKSTTSATATYTGKHPGSSTVGDVTATVTYTLNGVSVSSPAFPITVHAPTTFAAKNVVQPTQIYRGPDDYGFSGAELHFTVLDGLGQPVTGANWDETWDLQGNGQGPGPAATGGATLDDTGSSIDYFGKDNDPAPKSATNSKGDVVFGPLTHGYFVTDPNGTGSGGGVGCPVQTYTNVYYYTYGMVGNGF